VRKNILSHKYSELLSSLGPSTLTRKIALLPVISVIKILQSLIKNIKSSSRKTTNISQGKLLNFGAADREENCTDFVGSGSIK